MEYQGFKLSNANVKIKRPLGEQEPYKLTITPIIT